MIEPAAGDDEIGAFADDGETGGEFDLRAGQGTAVFRSLRGGDGEERVAVETARGSELDRKSVV